MEGPNGRSASEIRRTGCPLLRSLAFLFNIMKFASKVSFLITDMDWRIWGTRLRESRLLAPFGCEARFHPTLIPAINVNPNLQLTPCTDDIKSESSRQVHTTSDNMYASEWVSVLPLFASCTQNVHSTQLKCELSPAAGESQNPGSCNQVSTF